MFSPSEIYSDASPEFFEKVVFEKIQQMTKMHERKS